MNLNYDSSWKGSNGVLCKLLHIFCIMLSQYKISILFSDNILECFAKKDQS